ncbi:unnamed protein product [Brugia timori]|uniref:MSP domain-containing protein n=1 Tax=Brugia timori TaxID=42155 RepID=A0A0R3R6X9_9BILA|nr:unnamed protein product [Brugia timori]
MSYLQCTPAMIQVPCTGGTTTHILEAIGTERLAFKVKLKQKYYNLYRVSPPLGFVKPGMKKELFLRRLVSCLIFFIFLFSNLLKIS